CASGPSGTWIDWSFDVW
nr:immunoglobulin heavy chain junction region [Macaca mulatta]MOX59037.1 immunoglobulin heavy chain junction region [Macaca mulatta]MOX59095.1 immunoglobulin heavy chain junction region [Macaca mulatta]MOX60154.1 immunoglobulin heavy chain junction region [Macaca mulatta]MOX60604.1 immunoglobulin heavy chain junction region [Macaca mulatta]